MDRKLNKALSIQGSATGPEAQVAMMRSIVDGVNVAALGIIESFDSTNQTAKVQVTINDIDWFENKKIIEVKDSPYPLLVKVPVIFPGGGGWAMTFPLKKGDECLLIFNNNCISNWKKNGGQQEPAHWKRYHSMKDAVAIVGLRSPAEPLPQFNSDSPEIRTEDGSTKFTIKNGEVTFNGDIKISTGDVIADGISLKNHVHPSGTAVSVDPNTGIGATTAPTGTPT